MGIRNVSMGEIFLRWADNFYDGQRRCADGRLIFPVGVFEIRVGGSFLSWFFFLSGIRHYFK
jgi:hypothetical protein